MTNRYDILSNLLINILDRQTFTIIVNGGGFTVFASIRLCFQIHLYDNKLSAYGKANDIEQMIKKELVSMFFRPFQYFNVHSASAFVFRGDHIREYYDSWKASFESSQNIEKIISAISFPNIYDHSLRISGMKAELELLLTPTVSMGDSMEAVLVTVPKYLIDKELSDLAVSRVVRIEVVPADVPGGFQHEL